MVSLKKYIIKWLKILQTPIVKEYQYEVPFMIWCSDKYKKKYPAIINNIKKALHRSFRTDEICNVVFHISQLNTPYYRDKYDLLSPSFVPLDSVSQSMYN